MPTTPAYPEPDEYIQPDAVERCDAFNNNPNTVEPEHCRRFDDSVDDVLVLVLIGTR